MNILLYMIYYNMCAIPMHKSAGIYRKKASPFRIYSAPARLGKVTFSYLGIMGGQLSASLKLFDTIVM